MLGRVLRSLPTKYSSPTTTVEFEADGIYWSVHEEVFADRSEVQTADLMDWLDRKRAIHGVWRTRLRNEELKLTIENGDHAIYVGISPMGIKGKLLKPEQRTAILDWVSGRTRRQARVCHRGKLAVAEYPRSRPRKNQSKPHEFEDAIPNYSWLNVLKSVEGLTIVSHTFRSAP